MRDWLIRKLGGFPTVQEALTSLKESQNLELKHAVLTEAVKHLYNAIGPEDVLRREGDHLIFRGKPITEAEESTLQSQAEQFLNSRLWHVLRADIKWQLNKKMFLEANITMDVLWGKLIAWHEDVYMTRLKQLAGKK